MNASSAAPLVVADPAPVVSRPQLPADVTPQNFNWVMRGYVRNSPPEALYGLGEVIADWMKGETEHWFRVKLSAPCADIDPFLHSLLRTVARNADAVIFIQDGEITPDSGTIWFRDLDGWHTWGRSHHMRMYTSEEGKMLDSLEPIKLPKAPPKVPQQPIQLPV